MSKIRLLIISIIGVVVIGIVGCASGHFWLRSEASIRASLLKQTPLGTTSADVRAFVQRQGWLVPNYLGTTGFLKQETGKPIEVVGVTSIEGNIADFWLMNVTAYWGFDSSNRLIDIWVWKTYDGP